jgi:hypothetical protein
MESRLREKGREMAALPLEELLALWRQTKGRPPS